MTIVGHQLPLAIAARADSAAPVPQAIEAETSGAVSAALYEATQGDEEMTPENFLNALAEKLEGDPKDSPAKHAKSVKRHNWIMALLALVLGPGGAVAVIYATSDRAKANSADVENLKPRIEQNQADIRSIKEQVGDIDNSMDSVVESLVPMAAGIEELKAGNLSRLKEELEDAKRELRRQRNNP